MIILLQGLQGVPLLIAAAMLSVLSFAVAGNAWWRLVRRLRYMLLVLFLLFCWHTPGTLAWPGLGAWSPTVEGCRLALEHTGRILLVVAVVGLMLHLLDHAQWVQGIHGLLAPFARLGLPAVRLAVRLQLVLREAGRAEGTAWRALLAASPNEPGEPLAPLLLQPMRAGDVAAILLMFLAAGLLLAWGGSA